MKTANPTQSGEREGGSGVSRREALGGLGKLSVRTAAAASLTSAGLFGIMKKAYAQDGAPAFLTPDAIVPILNYALLLEYLEDAFYTAGVNTPGLIPSRFREVFEQIQEHENSHVQYLRTVISDVLGGEPIGNPADVATPTSFDFTANGTFAPFTSFVDFRVLAQGFEDTGVRAYKGQAANIAEEGLTSGDVENVLTQALRIHSVEARHAAEVRRINGTYQGSVQPKAWITGNDTQFPPLAPVYDLGDQGTTPRQGDEPVDLDADEANTTHLGVDVSTFTSDDVELTMARVTAAFDEPLTAPEVELIVDQFIDGIDADGDGQPN